MNTSRPCPPISGMFFNGAQIRLRNIGAVVDRQDAKGSWRVATIHPHALVDAQQYVATGCAMAAAGEMLAALQAVADKLGSRPYGTGSYLPKSLRDQVFAAIDKATKVEGGAA